MSPRVSPVHLRDSINAESKQVEIHFYFKQKYIPSIILILGEGEKRLVESTSNN